MDSPDGVVTWKGKKIKSNNKEIVNIRGNSRRFFLFLFFFSPSSSLFSLFLFLILVLYLQLLSWYKCKTRLFLSVIYRNFLYKGVCVYNISDTHLASYHGNNDKIYSFKHEQGRHERPSLKHGLATSTLCLQICTKWPEEI